MMKNYLQSHSYSNIPTNIHEDIREMLITLIIEYLQLCHFLIDVPLEYGPFLRN